MFTIKGDLVNNMQPNAEVGFPSEARRSKAVLLILITSHTIFHPTLVHSLYLDGTQFSDVSVSWTENYLGSIINLLPVARSHSINDSQQRLSSAYNKGNTIAFKQVTQ